MAGKCDKILKFWQQVSDFYDKNAATQAQKVINK